MHGAGLAGGSLKQNKTGNLIFPLKCSRRADHMGPGKSSIIVNTIPDCSL
jgi:hypothetical protein